MPGKHYGDAGMAQRCQFHKRHNACGRFSDVHQTRWGNSAILPDYKEAKSALLRIRR